MKRKERTTRPVTWNIIAINSQGAPEPPCNYMFERRKEKQASEENTNKRKKNPSAQTTVEHTHALPLHHSPLQLCTLLKQTSTWWS
jgi:hypothetical protein